MEKKKKIYIRSESMPDDEMVRMSDLFRSSETDLRDESILIHKNRRDTEAYDGTFLIQQESFRRQIKPRIKECSPSS